MTTALVVAVDISAINIAATVALRDSPGQDIVHIDVSSTLSQFSTYLTSTWKIDFPGEVDLPGMDARGCAFGLTLAVIKWLVN